MTTIVGADGCPSGWICVFEELPSRKLGSEIFGSVEELFAAAPSLQLLAIDIPIGLSDAGPRPCDVAARKRLGPIRGTSVFPAPLQPALRAASYPEACDVSFSIRKKKVSKQAWMIYPKISELDDLLAARPELRQRVHEVHPEVSFAEWNGGAIVEPKRKPAGFARRHALVRQHFGEEAFTTIRGRYARREVADDDILDAFAALWTAERITRGAARSLPDAPPLDAAGLPMRIVY